VPHLKREAPPAFWKRHSFPNAFSIDCLATGDFWGVFTEVFPRRAGVEALNQGCAFWLAPLIVTDPFAFPSPVPEAPERFAHELPREEFAREDSLAVLRAELEHRQRQIEAMSRASSTLFAQRTPEKVVKETLSIALELMGAGAGSLQMHDPARDELVFRFVVGPAADHLQGFSMPADQGIAGRVFQSGTPDITGDARSSREFNRSVDEQTGFTTQSMITVPIKRPGSAPVGVMQVLNFGANYDRFDLEVMEIIAGQSALALENAHLEQIARKAAMVNLIGDISHDIKNMLTPIQTGVWTLDPLLRQTWQALDTECASMPPQFAARVAKATKMAREEYQWILQNALDAAERVQIRTKEIADAVKGVSTPPRFVADNFNDVCLEVVSALRLVAYDRQVELVPDLDETLPLIEFDHKLIYNALYNLVNNALPETPEGGTVYIRTRHLGPRESNFSLEVADTGRGMPPHVRERLFTDEAISTKPGGTGLGTRIVADVVRRHRGHIAVQSEPGVGSTFTILLPLKQK